MGRRSSVRPNELLRGMVSSLGDVNSLVGEFKKESDMPIVLFSYFNPMLRYGIEHLRRDAASAGIDGVLITDVVER